MGIISVLFAERLSGVNGSSFEYGVLIAAEGWSSVEVETFREKPPIDNRVQFLWKIVI